MDVTLKLIPHDRSHFGHAIWGHSDCKTQSCKDSEKLVRDTAMKYGKKPSGKPYYYNGNCNSDLISEDKLYMCCIYNEWFTGRFNKQWYGWSFSNWGTSGIQLSGIWLVYEIEGLPARDLRDPNTPKHEPETEEE